MNAPDDGNLIAALPMYDWPETRELVDAEWSKLRALLRQSGMDAPKHLVRRNADMPTVPGGIRDDEGALIAPDPAALPPDELDFQTLWKHPSLLLAQTCWGPIEQGLAPHVIVVGQPSYDAFEGGQGETYSSAILMRCAADAGGGKESLDAPEDGRPSLSLDAIRGGRFAYNGPDSMSGVVALTRDLEAAGESLAVFSERLQTGSHRASLIAVAEGRADVCAVDCRSWDQALRCEPAARSLRVVGWTARRKGLPLITSVRTPPDTVARLRNILEAA